MLKRVMVGFLICFFMFMSIYKQITLNCLSGQLDDITLCQGDRWTQLGRINDNSEDIRSLLIVTNAQLALIDIHIEMLRTKNSQ